MSNPHSTNMQLKTLEKVGLVEIKQPDYEVELQIAYATEQNFTGSAVYGASGCYLREEASEKLQKAIKLAKLQGMRLRVFDAWRPLEVQQALWNHTPDPDFLSPPETGSVPHCRGVAVDLTLIDSNGNDLDMGTGFDEFTILSHHGNMEVSAQAQANRYLLMGIMLTAGWDFYSNEWWHYQLFNCRDYPIISDEKARTGLFRS